MENNSTSARMLFDAYNMYYDKAIDALKTNNYVVASRNLFSASESLLKLSKMSDGVLKETRIKRANEIYQFAEKIQSKLNKATNTSGSAKNDLEMLTKKAVAPSNASKTSTDDEEETVFVPTKNTGVKLSDVAGLKEAKQEISSKVIEPFKHPEIFKKYNKTMGGGILLYGVPGTGKTMFAQAVANDINAPFFSIKCSDIVSKWVGTSEKNIKTLFDEARKYPVAIIFFDEFEALAPKRGSHSTIMNRIVPEFLTQIQGFEKNNNNLIIIAATNRPWDIDTAFMRPGRFDRRIYVPIPDAEAREVIINKKLENIPCDSNIDINRIVDLTEGFNGSDVTNFCEKLKDLAIQREIDTHEESRINDTDVEVAASIIHSSVSPEDLKRCAEYQEEMNKGSF